MDVLAGEAEEDLGDLFGEQSGKEVRGDMAFPSDEPSGEPMTGTLTRRSLRPRLSQKIRVALLRPR